MIDRTVEELTAIIRPPPGVPGRLARLWRRSTVAGVRRHRGHSGSRPAPARALTPPERTQALDVLHSERFVDVSPEETWATLLDEGTYLCSPRTMCRILKAHHGGVRERRNKLTHPAYAKPELLAKRSNELRSSDVSRLKDPAKWTYYYVYVILDVFSRYVVGWTAQYRENGPPARALIEQATEQQRIKPPRSLTPIAARRSAPSRWLSCSPISGLVHTAPPRSVVDQ